MVYQLSRIQYTSTLTVSSFSLLTVGLFVMHDWLRDEFQSSWKVKIIKLMKVAGMGSSSLILYTTRWRQLINCMNGKLTWQNNMCSVTNLSPGYASSSRTRVGRKGGPPLREVNGVGDFHRFRYRIWISGRRVCPFSYIIWPQNGTLCHRRGKNISSNIW